MKIKKIKDKKVNEDIGKLITDFKATFEWDDFKYKVKKLCMNIGQKKEQKKRDSIMNLTNRLHRLRQRTLTPEISKDIETISTKLSKLEQDLDELLAIKSC